MKNKKKAILLSAGLKARKTKAVVISLNEEDAARDVVQTLQSISPRIKIFARAHNLKSSKDLLKMGVKFATPEIIESSFILGANVMENLGFSKPKINSLVDKLRENDYENIKKPLSVK